ncbi:MAG TPA: hypothetical protein IAA29_11945 [Candidatus Paenibacillus intestinavium]|nr:hypothetical protein [Candidatus Paenibacillus intestinavium]
MFDTVECPYCHCDNDMSEGTVDLPRDNKFDHECDGCGREFEVEVEFDPSYSASEIEYEDCQSCGESTRDPYKRGRVFPYPKIIEHDLVCEKCWKEAYRREIDQKRVEGEE